MALSRPHHFARLTLKSCPSMKASMRAGGFKFPLGSSIGPPNFYQNEEYPTEIPNYYGLIDFSIKPPCESCRYPSYLCIPWGDLMKSKRNPVNENTSRLYSTVLIALLTACAAEPSKRASSVNGANAVGETVDRVHFDLAGTPDLQVADVKKYFADEIGEYVADFDFVETSKSAGTSTQLSSNGDNYFEDLIANSVIFAIAGNKFSLEMAYKGPFDMSKFGSPSEAPQGYAFKSDTIFSASMATSCDGGNWMPQKIKGVSDKKKIAELGEQVRQCRVATNRLTEASKFLLIVNMEGNPTSPKLPRIVFKKEVRRMKAASGDSPCEIKLNGDEIKIGTDCAQFVAARDVLTVGNTTGLRLSDQSVPMSLPGLSSLKFPDLSGINATELRLSDNPQQDKRVVARIEYNDPNLKGSRKEGRFTAGEVKIFINNWEGFISFDKIDPGTKDPYIKLTNMKSKEVLEGYLYAGGTQVRWTSSSPGDNSFNSSNCATTQPVLTMKSGGRVVPDSAIIGGLKTRNDLALVLPDDQDPSIKSIASSSSSSPSSSWRDWKYFSVAPAVHAESSYLEVKVLQGCAGYLSIGWDEFGGEDIHLEKNKAKLAPGDVIGMSLKRSGNGPESVAAVWVIGRDETRVEKTMKNPRVDIVLDRDWKIGVNMGQRPFEGPVPAGIKAGYYMDRDSQTLLAGTWKSSSCIKLESGLTGSVEYKLNSDGTYSSTTTSYLSTMCDTTRPYDEAVCTGRFWAHGAVKDGTPTPFDLIADTCQVTLKNAGAAARHNLEKICGGQWSADAPKTISAATCDSKGFRDEFYFLAQGRYWLMQVLRENGKLRWKWADVSSGEGSSEYSRPNTLTTDSYLDRQ